MHSNTTFDWIVMGEVQAEMRLAIKKILRKQGYAPDMELKAIETAIEQAKLLADDFSHILYGSGSEYNSIASEPNG